MDRRSEQGLSVGAPVRFGSNQTCSKTEEAADGSVRACNSKQRSSNVGCRDVGLLGLIQVGAEHQWRAPGGTVMVRQRWRLTGVWQLGSDVAGQQWNSEQERRTSELRRRAGQQQVAMKQASDTDAGGAAGLRCGGGRQEASCRGMGCRSDEGALAGCGVVCWRH